MNIQSTKPVDRNSFVPYYVQVKEHLKHQIEQGAWQPGQQLPSEAELCNIYDISRTVIRRALQELQYEGLIYRKKGKGSFVAEPKVHELLAQNLTGFFHDMVEQGHQVSSRVLRQELREASEELARILEVRPHAPLVMCERLRLVDGSAINVSISHVPHDRCPEMLGADLTNQSLYSFVERACGQRIVRGRRTIEAILPSRHIAQLMDIGTDLPVFRINNICYLEDGTPIEHSCGYHRSDRTFFEVALLRETAANTSAASAGDSGLPQGYKLTTGLTDPP